MRGAPDALSGVRASAWGVLVAPMCEECRQFSGICAARASTLPRAARGTDEGVRPSTNKLFMLTVLTLIPVVLIAGFAMYLQYRTLSEARRKSPLWRTMCVLPVLAVGVFLVWIAIKS